MFYTISYNNSSAEVDSVSKMASNHTFGECRQSRLACIECRARKVKCSGESTGCQRCQGTGITCVFPERTKRGTKRRKNSAPSDNHSSSKSNSGSETSLHNGDSGSNTSAAPTGDSYPLASTVPTSEFSPSLDFSPSYFSLDLSDNFNIGDSPSIKDGNICACAQSALHMLEELELQYENGVDVSSDTILGYQKIALARLNSWISCDHSHTPRATTKLIVLVIEGLSLYLERGAANCIRQMRQEVEDEDPSAAAGMCSVGDYHVESKHEWAHILRVSLLVRCRELLAAVTRLKQVDVNDVLLPAVETRLSRVIQELKGWEDYL
ncbi:hypothetical protein ACHAPX_003175 [Trichoderma viride]